MVAGLFHINIYKENQGRVAFSLSNLASIYSERVCMASLLFRLCIWFLSNS